MENGERGVFPKSAPMNSGEGPYSYVKNSFYQKGGLESVKAILDKEIAVKFDINQLLPMPSSPKQIKIADFGCSTGPNTFISVQNIIQAINLKYPNLHHNLEYQVFFNDHSSNDFNTLFNSLPPERNYFAAGVPGSFHSRLFPQESLHFVHSSYAIQWLFKIPKEVTEKNSPAWTKGRIHYETSKEAKDAYSGQFGEEMEVFLRARAEELVCGGFMALLIPCIPIGANPSKCTLIAVFEFLSSSFMDMANMGLLDESKVDSFNLPLYLASPKEMEGIIERNGCFSIEKTEQFPRHPMPEVTKPNIKRFALGLRAGFEELIRQQFGGDVIDELFDRFTQKLIDSCIFSDSSYLPMFDLFVLLKCQRSSCSKVGE